MKNLKEKDVVKIQCYKHNGKVYREWDKSVILEIDEEHIVCANNRVRVTESDGRKWSTNEPAVLFFYKNNWFNIIAQFKDKGIYYYCNIASPYIIEEKTIKYIDYDLDLRVFPDNKYRILDKAEYEYHKEKMEYPDDIDKVVNYELNNLIKLYKNKEGPFSKEFLNKYYLMYTNLKRTLI